MISLLLSLALTAAPCASPEVARLPEEQQISGCQVAALDAPAAKDTSTVEEIYSRPGFERARQRNTGALLAMFERLKNWLTELFESGGASAYSEITRFLVLVVAAVVVAWAVTRWLGRRERREEQQARAQAEPLVLQPPQQHLSRGRELLAADPRAAIREGLLALLSSLERQRWARPDRVKTNREILRELPERGAPGEVVSKVSPLLGWYDSAWYSLEPVPVEAAGRFLDDVATLELGR